MMTDFHKALLALRPGINFSNLDNTLAGVRWDAPLPDDFTPPTQAEVDAELAKLAAAAAAIEVPFFYLKLELKARPVGDTNLFHIIDAYCQEVGGDALFKWLHAPNADSTNELLLAVAQRFGIADQVPDIFKAAKARIGNT